MKYLTGLILASFLIMTVSVSAQTKTATPSPSALESGAKELREKLEDKVAELTKKDDKAVSGTITAAGDGKIAISTSDGAYSLKVDSVLTKFYDIVGTEQEEIEVSALEKGDYIIVSGPISDRVVTANFVYRDAQFFEGSGQITEVNATDFYLKVLEPTKETVTLDVESTTKRLLADVKALTTESVGFTKIKEGDTVHFVYKKTGEEKEKNRFSAVKVLVIPQEYFHK